MTGATVVLADATATTSTIKTVGLGAAVATGTGPAAAFAKKHLRRQESSKPWTGTGDGFACDEYADEVSGEGVH
jgi:hypothetical protein